MPLTYTTNLILDTNSEGARLDTIKRVTGAWYTVDSVSDVYAITGSATLRNLLLPGQIFYVKDTDEMLIYSQSGAFPFTTDHFNSFTWPGSGGSVSTGSLLTTASVAGTTMTFTKGDSSTFDVTLPGSGGTPGGSPGEVQFNDGGSFGGDPRFIFAKSTGLAQLSGSLQITGSTENIFLIKSGSVDLLRVSSSGAIVFGDLQHTPPPVAGGFFYSSSAFYVGVE